MCGLFFFRIIYKNIPTIIPYYPSCKYVIFFRVRLLHSLINTKFIYNYPVLQQRYGTKIIVRTIITVVPRRLLSFFSWAYVSTWRKKKRKNQNAVVKKCRLNKYLTFEICPQRVRTNNFYITYIMFLFCPFCHPFYSTYGQVYFIHTTIYILLCIIRVYLLLLFFIIFSFFTTNTITGPPSVLYIYTCNTEYICELYNIPVLCLPRRGVNSFEKSLCHTHCIL